MSKRLSLSDALLGQNGVLMFIKLGAKEPLRPEAEEKWLG